METQSELINHLEKIVDNTSLYEVIAALGLMCFEKSEHIQCNYNDDGLAKSWEKSGNKIMKLAKDL